MSHSSPLPLELLRRIDQASDRFEAAWQAGTFLRLEELLGEFPEHEQPAVLRELLAMEIELTRRQGLSPSATSYRSRFARHAQIVDKVLSRLGLSEQIPSADKRVGHFSDQNPPNEASFVTLTESKIVISPVASSLPANASRYSTTRLLAQGGLGLVYVAEDTELHRKVALKEIKDKFVSVPMHRQQFLFEAEVTGALEHPGVVPVHGLGTYPDGRPYYAMRLIRGVSLKEAVRRYFQHPSVNDLADSPPDATTNSFLDEVIPADRSLAFRELLARFCDVCNTLEYARSRGVLHRDLKPDNIMLGKYGETFVVDWGLAALIDVPFDQPLEETLLRTRLSGSGKSGSVVGTPGYMSPEQASGAERLTSATDVYGLGATLYFLLTGQPPVSMSGKLTEVLERVRSGNFPAPNKVRADVPAALNAVCMKALARQPAERYSSALELKRDLQRWLADEPVTVYREPWPTRARRWSKRHKTLVTTTAVSVALLLAGWGAWNWREYRRVDGIRNQTLAALEKAETAVEQHQLAAAKRQLNDAVRFVQQEPALTDLQSSVAVLEGHWRLVVRTDAEQSLRQAQALVDLEQWTNAATLFMGVENELDGDNHFADLLQRAQAGKQRANAHEIETIRWQEFRRLAEKARFFGSHLSGGGHREAVQQADSAAEEALRKYGLHDQPFELISIPAEWKEELRSFAFELFLIRSETQVLLNTDAGSDPPREILQSALELLSYAEKLTEPQISRLVWDQRAALLKKSGKLSEAETAAQMAKQVPLRTALEFFLAGEQARRVERNFARAESFYLQALNESPRDFWIHYALGACQLQRLEDETESAAKPEGYLSSAMHALTSSRALAPSFPWPLVLRGVIYAKLGDFPKAEQDFAEAEASCEDERASTLIFDPGLLRSAVRVNRTKLRMQQAKQATDDVQRDHYYQRAVAELQVALVDRDLVPALMNLGIVFTKLKRFEDANKAWTEALNRTETQDTFRRAEILRFRGDGNFLRDGDDNDLTRFTRDPQLLLPARQDYSDALRILDAPPLDIPNSKYHRQQADLRYRIGLTYFATGEWSSALIHFDDAIREGHADPDLHRFRGQCWMGLGKFNDAFTAYVQYAEKSLNLTASARKPADVRAIRTLAMLGLQLGNEPDGGPKLREALFASSVSLKMALDGKVSTKRGWLLTTGVWPIVLEDFDRAIQWHAARGEEDWEAYAGRAFARAKLGQHEDAIDDIEKAIRLGLQQIDNEPPPINPQQQKGILLFNAACTYAVVLRNVRFNKHVEPSHEKNIQNLTQRAIELLRLAQDRLGRDVLAKALSDDALDSVRETNEFKSFQKQLTGSIDK